ncbi:YopX family protein [Staphylococcus caeli]|uniref:YopX family protein n=1 Tax=Staphylococcus caeli TaxID=2201815 RepID=UPI003F5712F0
MIPKFRAWDKKTKLMNDVTVVDFENKEVYYNHWRYGHSEAISFKDVELLQSTGIKDRNGVEIYEGDVVECFSEGLSVVEYRYGGFGLVCNKYFESFVNVLGGVEVIGNKYEHPHLLKE